MKSVRKCDEALEVGGPFYGPHDHGLGQMTPISLPSLFSVSTAKSI